MIKEISALHAKWYLWSCCAAPWKFFYGLLVTGLC